MVFGVVKRASYNKCKLFSVFQIFYVISSDWQPLVALSGSNRILGNVVKYKYTE